MMQTVLAVWFMLLAGVAAAQGPRQLKPGWNLFSTEQDIQLGKEAAAQVEKQYVVVGDAELANYIRGIGSKLAAAPEADKYPYTFKVVADRSINAFALPGGPAFVHTGLLSAADNEAQVAGVLAHEVAHVALRHGTNQASKTNLIQLPALLASGMLGKGGSIPGQLTQLGIGLGANSVLLKFSRAVETDADLLGARMMASAGCNPLEMARFFEKLEAAGGSRGPQFLSDHPNPGNGVKAVEAGIRSLPQASYTAGGATEFARMQRLAAAVPTPAAKQGIAEQVGAAPATPRISASRTLREHRASTYTISYPNNWQSAPSPNSQGVSLAPREGYVRRDTAALVQQLASENANMRAQGAQGTSKAAKVGGQAALITTLQAPSPFAGETEIDTLITVERPEGLFFVMLIAPQSLSRSLQEAFELMLRSIRL
jgi:predicted Zn-dependent protease